MTSLLEQLKNTGKPVSLIPISTDISWGKSSTALVDAIYNQHVSSLVALDRASSHLAEQIGTKAFVPVIAISSDRMLTSANIPWIFRLPPETSLVQAVQLLSSASRRAGQNREQIREVLSSGTSISGISFQSTGELK